MAAAPVETSVDAGAPAAPPAPACTLARAEGAPPDLLVEADPPPAPPPRPARGAHGRRMIVLDEIDGYGPIHLYRASGDGVLTDLGAGSDPRWIDARHWGYLVADLGARTASFVVVDDAGNVTRTEGGNGRVGGIGGPPVRRSPFTRDGRFMAEPGECSEPTLAGDCVARVYDHYPLSARDTPIDTVPLLLGRELFSLSISEDGARLATSYRDAPGEIFDRTTRHAVSPALEGLALALTPDLSLALVVAVEGIGASRVETARGTTEAIPTHLEVRAAAFDACAESVVLVGAAEDGAQRVERHFFDGRAPVVLLERADEPLFYRVEIDPRGWLLVLGDEGDVEGRSVVTWTLPLAGGEARRTIIAHESAIWSVVLGPDAGAPWPDAGVP